MAKKEKASEADEKVKDSEDKPKKNRPAKEIRGKLYGSKE